MYHTKSVTLRLTEDLLERLDAQRGGIPRGSYIRAALELHLDAIENQPVPTGSLRPVGEPVRPDHVHEWKRAGSIFDRCECGETRRR